MRRLINLTIAAFVVLAVGSGVAAAQIVDHISSPARDSVRQISSPQTDLRSPDARDASTRPPLETYAPGHVPQPSPVLSVATGEFEWGDAGIGAAGMLALVAVGSGAFMILSQRRRDRHFRPATH